MGKRNGSTEGIGPKDKQFLSQTSVMSHCLHSMVEITQLCHLLGAGEMMFVKLKTENTELLFLS